jgi:APA family basic amino acid/polyamine antiporter
VTPPKRQLGILVAAAIVVANMIGAGVFTGAGFQAADLHDPWVMLSTWVVGGVLALCGASAYAELGSLMPHAGGEYVYLREAYHPAVGFMSGWVSMTAGFSAPVAAAALAFSAYLSTVIPGLVDPLAQKVVASVLIVGVTCLHAFDTKLGGRVQTAFTIAKVALIAALVGAGLLVGHGSWSNFARQGEGFGMLASSAGAAAFATSLMYVSFAYSGWNAAAYIAGEIATPQRTLPRALMLGTGAVMGLYILLNLTFLYATPPQTMAGVKEVGALAAGHLFGPKLGELLSVMIALALVSSVSAMMMAGPRVYAAMAADHALPKQLAYYSARGVPSVAVAAQCVLAIVFVMIGSLGELIEFVGFTLAIFAALTVAAVFVFRARGKQSPYRTWGYPVTPILFVLMSAWIVYYRVAQHPLQSLAVAGLLAVGAVIYLFTARGKTHTPMEADEDDLVPAAK